MTTKTKTASRKQTPAAPARRARRPAVDALTAAAAFASPAPEPIARAAQPAGLTVALQPVPSAQVTAAIITVAELAGRLGAAHTTVQKRARAMGARKVGKTYLLTEAQAAAIAAALTNPDKAGPKARAIAAAEAETAR